MNVTRDQLMAASIGNMDWLQLCMKAAGSQVLADRYRRIVAGRSQSHHGGLSRMEKERERERLRSEMMSPGFTALHMAALHSRLQCLQLLLEDHGVDVNAPSVYGWRALHLVMNRKSGHRAMPCLRYLLQRGADVNVMSKTLTTPLHRAATEGLEDCVAVLVEAGADVHAKDSQGNKPIDLCHLWCRRPSARYLRSAMWKKDKQDYAQELRKMEKIKRNIEDVEQDAILKMQIPFSPSTETRNLTERLTMVNLEMETLPKSKAAHPSTYSSDTQGGQSISSKMTKKGITRSNKKAVPNGRGERASGGKSSFWNASTNPHRPPTLYIYRVPTPWQGIYPEDVTKKDISSRVLLSKDEQGQLRIQTLQGQVFPPPGLPYEVIERSLFPKRGPQDRIQSPKDFKATHVLDVPRKQQPTQKPASSEISFHLRQNLDSKFRKSHKETAPLPAAP